MIKYYTDWHGVDEDQTSINKYGGCWHWGDWVGVMYRDILDAPDTTWDPTTVASVQKKINRTYSPFGDACFV